MKTTRTDHQAVKGRPSATVQVGWQICRRQAPRRRARNGGETRRSFANGSCTCNSRNHYPRLSVQITARAVIEAAKEGLAETCVPRMRPHKAAVMSAGYSASHKASEATPCEEGRQSRPGLPGGKPAGGAASDRDGNKFLSAANPQIDEGKPGRHSRSPLCEMWHRIVRHSKKANTAPPCQERRGNPPEPCAKGGAASTASAARTAAATEPASMPGLLVNEITRLPSGLHQDDVSPPDATEAAKNQDGAQNVNPEHEGMMA